MLKIVQFKVRFRQINNNLQLKINFLENVYHKTTYKILISLDHYF